MKIRLAAITTAAAITGFAATSIPALAAVEVGVLRCNVAPSVGYVVASERDMRCAFKPNDGGRTQYYNGKAGRVGLDLGYTKDAKLIWGVYAPTRKLSGRSLAGTYAGGSAGAAIGLGVGGKRACRRLAQHHRAATAFRRRQHGSQRRAWRHRAQGSAKSKVP